MLFWLSLALLSSVHGSNNVCPDGSLCPDPATCCELAKTYGCCPLENAVCCDDHIHCCPHNTRCEAGTCLQPHGLNVTSKRLIAKDENIHCFGSKYVCPDFFTCCKGQKAGSYGCCPLMHAVCCSDGVHCCPEGTVCDIKEEKCIGKGYISEMYDSQKNKLQVHEFLKYLPLTKASNLTSIICPDSSFLCPDGYTCCKLPNGDWGCCPFVNATCCNDHLHCCPQNMQCDSTSRSCSQGHVYIPSLLKELSKPVSSQIICPDNSSCAESMTCCELNHKRFGCCQYTDAVCCEDHRHCCPSGSICDVIGKRCIPELKQLYNVLSKYYKKLD